MELEFKFSKIPGVDAMEVEVTATYFEESIGQLIAGDPGIIMLDPKVVGSLMCTFAGEGMDCEIWDNNDSDHDAIPVAYVPTMQDFPRFVMFEIPKESWIP